MSKMLPENGYYLQHYDNPSIIKDMRFVNGVQIMNRMAVFVFSGYTYHREHLDDEYMTAELLSPFTFNKYNRNATFTIHEQGFNNNFYVFHKYFDSFSSAEFRAVSQPTVKIENVAARIRISVEYGGTKYDLEMKGAVVVRLAENVNSDGTPINTTLISFATKCVFIAGDSDPVRDAEQVCEKYAAWFDLANRSIEY